VRRGCYPISVAPERWWEKPQDSRKGRIRSSGFAQDCLPDKLGLNSGKIIGLRGKHPHTGLMYNRTLASAYTVVRPVVA
jgi:hypothetical protein